jgi:hypothetical protein
MGFAFIRLILHAGSTFGSAWRDQVRLLFITPMCGAPRARLTARCVVQGVQAERYEIYEGCTCAHDHCARSGGAADEDHRADDAEPTERRKRRPRTTTEDDDATSSEATEEEAEGGRDVKKSKRQRRSQTSDGCACLARMGGRVAYDPSSHRLLPDYFPELERCDATHTTSEREDGNEEAHDTDAAAAATSTTATTRHQPTDRPLFECHSRCGCSADCASRVVQKGACRVPCARSAISSRCSSHHRCFFPPAGITLPLEVFMSATKGWSVRVLSPIREGEASCLCCLASPPLARAQQPS